MNRVIRRRQIPNTLVHVAVHSTVFAPFGVPFTAIFAGCVIPDLPWITKRLVDAAGISLDPISAYAYFIAQASLVGCFFACMACGFLFRNYKSVTAFVFLGCLAHLLLDSIQDKWGNGVHLIAPLSWEFISFGIIQLDTIFIYLVALAGLMPFWFIAKARQEANLLCLLPTRLAACAICLVAYMIVPAIFIGEVIASNSRYLETLENVDDRRGKLLELDRETATVIGDATYATTHTGEMLTIVNPGRNISDGGTYSFRGVFQDKQHIRLIDWKRHSGARDIASYIGLLAISGWISAVLISSRRRKRTVTDHVI